MARLAPCSRWRLLTGWSSLKLRVVGGSWFSPLCSPGSRSASRSTYSVLPPVSRLFFGLAAFSFGRGFGLCLTILLAPCGCRCACCGLPCGCESARVLPSLLGPSPSGVCHLSRVCSSVGGPVGVAHSFWWPCPLLRWALLTLSGYVLSVPSAVFFASVSLIDPVALSPLLHRVFADSFSHWCAFRLSGGASPHAFGSVGALGKLRWLHLYRLTPDLVGLCRFAVWLRSSGRCFLFSCATFCTSPWRSFCQFSCLLRVPASYFP